MNYKIIFLIFLALTSVTLMGCKRQATENPNETILKGHIGFPVHGPLYLTGYADSIEKFLGIKTVLDTAKIDENGNYRFLIHSVSAGIYDLKTSDSLLLPSIYITPHNKLIINMDRKLVDPVIDTSDMEGKYNDFREKLTWKFFKENATNQFYYIGANYLTLKQFDTFVQGRRNKMLALYNSYFKGDKVSSDFEKFAKAEINYQYGIDKMMFLWKHRIKDIDIFPDSSYYKDITEKTYINNPGAIGSPAYYHYLNLYINNIYGETLARYHLPTPPNPPVSKYKLALRYLEEPARDIVIFNIVYGDMTPAEYRILKAGNSKPVNEALYDWFFHKYPEMASEKKNKFKN